MSRSSALVALLCLCALAAAAAAAPQERLRDRARVARQQQALDKQLDEAKAKLLARARKLGICMKDGALVECGKASGT